MVRNVDFNGQVRLPPSLHALSLVLLQPLSTLEAMLKLPEDCSPLHRFQVKPRYGTQNLLDRKATSRVKDKRQQLPLHRAAAVGSVPMIKLLLEHNSPLNATDASGQTALHHGT